MSENIPQRTWLPLGDAVKHVSERLGVTTEVARRALFNALKDEVTRARGSFWDGSNDREFSQGIDLAMLLNEDMDWENDTINFNEPMLFPQISGGQFYSIYHIEVCRPDLDEWLKAHSNSEPTKSHHKDTDVVDEKAVATKSPPLRRRKGGPRTKPYLGHLHKFLDSLLALEGSGYFTRGIGTIEKDVRKRFRTDDPQDTRGLPKTRSGLQDPIKKWAHENDVGIGIRR